MTCVAAATSVISGARWAWAGCLFIYSVYGLEVGMAMGVARVVSHDEVSIVKQDVQNWHTYLK